MDRKILLDIITDKSVRIIHGIGEQMEKRLNEFRIFKVKDLQMKTLEFMKEHFGVYGVFLHYMSWGIDDREIVPYFEEVGIGNSRTLDYNVYGIDEIKKAMIAPLKMTCYRLKNLGKYAKNVQIKLRYGDFVTITRAKQLKYPINTPAEVYKEVCNLLETKVDNYSNIRLVGLKLSSFSDTKTKQFNLFDNPAVWKKKNILDDIAYALRKEHGYDIVKDALGVKLNKKRVMRKMDVLVEGLNRSEIIERLNVLKVFIDDHNIRVYEKIPNKYMKRIVDLWDYNNTCGITVFTNNVVRIDGEESLLKETVVAILNKKKFNVHDFDYFRELNKENS